MKVIRVNAPKEQNLAWNIVFGLISVVFCLGYHVPEGLAADVVEQTVIRHFDGVLGTSMDITIHGVADDGELEGVVQQALARTEELESALSSFRPDSELMLLNAENEGHDLSKDLFEVLQQCQAWSQRSQQKFNCRLGSLIQYWQHAEEEQELPERIAVRAMTREVNEAEFVLDEDSRSVLIGDVITLDPSGLAKGYVIDQVMQLLLGLLPEASAIKVDIGGDASYWGKPPEQSGWQIGIANPLASVDNSGFIAELNLESVAVAASGHDSRYYTIDRKQFSHILNSRDGWPVENGVAAIVVAKDAITADAVATALTLQTQSDGLEWVNSLSGIEALLIGTDGRKLSSDGWSAFSSNEALVEQEGQVVLSLDYVLPEFNAADYNRPYVAIWITDTSQKALKNLLLLGETERWARENSRWWRRVGRRNPQLLDGVARSTRGAGEYTLQWNGIDDFGEVVPEGDYLLHLEASRENGGSNYLNIPFSLGGNTALFDVDADGEIGQISVGVNQ